MEKVKITKKQAESIKDYKMNQGTDLQHFLDAQPFYGVYKALNNMSVNDLARALYIGYEVEPEIKEGDYVISEVTGKIGKVTEIKPNGHVVTDIKLVSHRDDFFLTGKPSMFEKKTPQEIATEKERRFFAENGRKPWELRSNDVVSYQDFNWGGIYIVSGNEHGRDACGNRLVRLFSQNARDGQVLSFDARKLKVVCFAEDRKDIGGN